MKRFIAIAVIAAAAGAWAQERKEAAFGFWKGMTHEQAQQAARLTPVPGAPYYYATTSPPRPVYPFVAYTIAVGPNTGVCVVLAQTEHKLDGSKIYKDMAESVLTMFWNKYGQPTHTSETATSRMVKWSNAQGKGTSVDLTIQHADDGTVYLQAAYSFSNFDRCRQEILQGL